MKFNAEKEMQQCIKWTKDWFDIQSGGAKGLVVGISGGKDSTIVAALCAKAIGKENVLGIRMPNNVQEDLEDSEKYIGYSTKWGDGAADFNPIGRFTSEEVVMIGSELGLPDDLIYKVPSDGLCGKSDEDNFGFTYKILNEYIRTGICRDVKIKEKVDWMHTTSEHKRDGIPNYEYF